MENAKRDRRAEVVREMIGKSMSYMFFCSFHFRVVVPSWGKCWSSRLLSPVILLSCSSSPSSSPSFCPPPSGIFHQRRVWLAVDGGIAALQTHSSLHCLLPLTLFTVFSFHSRVLEHFSSFPAVVTHSVGESWEQGGGETKRLREN